MPLDEFWYGDMRLLSAYQKAFIKNQSYNAWLQRLYNSEAGYVAVRNNLATKKTEQIKYGDYVDSMAKFEKPKITKENLENEFRKQLAEQNAWLFNR